MWPYQVSGGVTSTSKSTSTSKPVDCELLADSALPTGPLSLKDRPYFPRKIVAAIHYPNAGPHSRRQLGVCRQVTDLAGPYCWRPLQNPCQDRETPCQAHSCGFSHGNVKDAVIFSSLTPARNNPDQTIDRIGTRRRFRLFLLMQPQLPRLSPRWWR
jgi:hypothetical protein